MYRIGIIGSENSHAGAFAKIFNQPDETGSFPYPDCKVTAVAGNYPEENEKLFNEFGLALLAKTPEEMLGQVDAVMITARDGKFHLGMAKPFLDAGIPMFVDKPLTVSTDEALTLTRLAKTKGVPICGGSAVRLAPAVEELATLIAANPGKLGGGSVTAPLAIESEYSGFYFYASHLAEVSLKLFGFDVKTVTAKRTKNDVTVIAEYENFAVSNHYIEGSIYQATVYLDKNTYVERTIDNSLIFRNECKHFVHMLRTGEMPQPFEQLIAPVFYMKAIEESYTNGGKTVPVIIPEL